MTTLAEFITKYNNKYIEVADPSSYAQCFDLVLKWCSEIDVPTNIFPFMYAYQIYTDFGTEQAKYFTRIYNSPDAVPKEGDVLVWGNSYNYAGGHTGIFKSGDVWTLTAFEQNDPFKTPSHLKSYDYRYILGWLRPKYYSNLTKEQRMLAIINSGISDSDFRNKVRTIYGV